MDDLIRTRVADGASSMRPAVDESAAARSGRRGAVACLTETEARVRALFLSRLQLEVDADMDVIESGVLDSMAFVQLLLELENEFATTVSMASLDLEDFRSVRSIARYVESLRAAP